MRRAVAILALAVLAGCAGPGETAPRVPRSEREKRYRAYAALDDYEGQWRAAMVAAELCDPNGTEHLAQSERLEFAKTGVGHADRAIKLNDAGVEAHYYRALCVGRILENEKLPTVSLVLELEKSAKRAAELDPRFECSGAHRMLASVYSEAPSVGGAWAIGDSDLAEEHFQKALSFAPECPENHLAYLKLLVKEESLEREKGLEMLAKARALIDPHKDAKFFGEETRVRLHQECQELEKKLNDRT